MAVPLNDIIRNETSSYLSEHVDPDNPPLPSTIESVLLDKVNDSIEVENVGRPKRNQLPFLKTLTNFQIATILLRLHTIRRIALSGLGGDEDLDVVGMYMDSGVSEGVFVEAETVIRRMARRYNNALTVTDYKEIITILGDEAERVERCSVEHYSPVNNGVFDAERQVLLPFSPEMVWMGKSEVDYNPAATSPVFHNDEDGTDWEYHEWKLEVMGGDFELAQLIDEVNSALLFPNRRFDKFIAPYATSGNNGKGTLNEMWRALVGRRAVCDLDIAGFDKEFPNESIVRSHAIIADENPVGAYLDKVSNFKAAVTGDVIPINRKFKKPTSIRFWGLIIQPLNGKLRLKDKSDSFWRRALMIPFPRSFTGSVRPYIKKDYVTRRELLEYVMKEALHLNAKELSNPKACQDLLGDQKMFADPVRAFFGEVSGQLVWDFVPFEFLYALYISWFSENIPTGSPVAKTTFVDELMEIVEESTTWRSSGKSQRVRPSGRMSDPEPLIVEYNVAKWLNPMARNSNDVNKKAVPLLKQNYTGGLFRNAPGLLVVEDDEESGEGESDDAAEAS